MAIDVGAALEQLVPRLRALFDPEGKLPVNEAAITMPGGEGRG
jgi:hypothetical protein